MKRSDTSIPHRLIITFGGIKGGSGRSTFALHAAVQAANAGLRTLLMDADEQGCGNWFTERRATLHPALPRYTCASRSSLTTKNPRDLPRRIEQLTETYDRVIIDIGGTESAFQNAVLDATHILLVPVEPTPFEAIGLSRLEQVVYEARKAQPDLVAYAALNRAGMPGAVKNDREMATRLRASKELQYIDAPIPERCSVSAVGRAGPGSQRVEGFPSRCRSHSGYGEIAGDDTEPSVVRRSHRASQERQDREGRIGQLRDNQPASRGCASPSQAGLHDSPKLFLTDTPVRAIAPAAHHRRAIRHVVATPHAFLRQRIQTFDGDEVTLR